MRPNFTTEHPFTTDRDLSSSRFWEQTFEEREETFRWLRENQPVSWHEPLETEDLPPEVHGERGFWAVTLAEDITHVSQNHEGFSSERGDVTLRPLYQFQRDQAPTFLIMDPPRHTQYRRIISSAFTPKSVAKLNSQITQRAAEIVDRVVGAGDIDFVREVSSKLPMLTVADLVGVPESLIGTFAEAGDNWVSIGDAEVRPPGVSVAEFAMQQLATIREIGVDLVQHRRAHPSDDIATALAEAEFDGHQLSDDDIGAMMLLLSVAGNDTTKQTTTRTVVALDRNPDQRAWLAEDFDGRIATSIEEFVRHACPVIEFARTATHDTELRGVHIAEGDKVAMFYCSGNRDESVFPDAGKFDLTRPRTPHVGFGGGGVHFCLGNGVAKAQLRALFNEVLTKLPHIEVGEPENLTSEFINGVKRLPVRV
jgi:cytochrome P450